MDKWKETKQKKGVKDEEVYGRYNAGRTCA